MRLSATFNLAAIAVPVFLQSVSGWSFTMYDTEDCSNSTNSDAVADRVERQGDVDCDAVLNADRHKSVLGEVPAGSECRISFYPVKDCGGRVAFSLTQDTTSCLSIDDLVAPLAYYSATDCT
ncbi:hypothetical protein F4813DRAFT_374347 [Daldinia decipiens]|uniref:uncharacterized protein n=1 Tax=Daldinia decipiens TaxID=326647 RepID=UPI0020C32BC3|nr:uncharacterized protein F4813DRAFT_374347 [Daldinia decipiens]KAI1653452.1 hypothetical protein F4813DRAFT_374347 [Daldinia decipiens]